MNEKSYRNNTHIMYIYKKAARIVNIITRRFSGITINDAVVVGSFFEKRNCRKNGDLNKECLYIITKSDINRWGWKKADLTPSRYYAKFAKSENDVPVEANRYHSVMFNDIIGELKRKSKL